jgi:rare lipoprotein A
LQPTRALILLLLFIAACAVPRSRSVRAPLPHPGGATQTGIASWYGPGFHGQLTASGAIYNQHDLTAAHPSLPLGTRVLVTNLTNGSTAEVRINDRGPFVKGRIIDLTNEAAESIGMIGPGTAPVRVEVIDTGSHRIRAIPAALDYTLQLGSFARLANAREVRDRVAEIFSDVVIVPLQASESTYYRVRVGTFSDRTAAEERARHLAHFGLPIIIMEK